MIRIWMIRLRLKNGTVKTFSILKLALVSEILEEMWCLGPDMTGISGTTPFLSPLKTPSS